MMGPRTMRAAAGAYAARPAGGADHRRKGRTVWSSGVLGARNIWSTVVILGAVAFGRVPQVEADRSIELAMQHGVNHIDVAPSYGEAELRLGPWLARHRDDFFLACKTTKRTREAAREELHRSLDRLRVAIVGPLQLHAVKTVDELDAAMAPGGAIEALAEAREAGLVRSSASPVMA